MLTVFAYGTLKPGEAAYRRYCEPYLTAAQPAWVRGQLFHLPQGYPALTVGDRWVEGALLQLRAADAIAHIDAFEDYDPNRPETANLYVRKTCQVFSAQRELLGSAWVYLMERQRVIDRGGIAVLEGVWSGRHWPSIATVEPSIDP